jgi:hypothetical protein
MRAEDRIDAMLDHGLEMTFPASDPFTIYFPEIETDDQDPPRGMSFGRSAIVAKLPVPPQR